MPPLFWAESEQNIKADTLQNSSCHFHQESHDHSSETDDDDDDDASARGLVLVSFVQRI